MKRNTEDIFESLAACSTLGTSIAAASQMVKGALHDVIIYLTAERFHLSLRWHMDECLPDTCFRFIYNKAIDS